MSPSLTEPDENGGFKICPFPNKAMYWLRGRNPSAIANTKNFKGEVPIYDALQELRDGILRLLYKERLVHIPEMLLQLGLGAMRKRQRQG